MNSDKIQLPDFLIADLYKGNLVDIPLNQVKETTATKTVIGLTVESDEAAAINFLGENNKYVTVLVNQPATTHIADTDLTFLANVLKACSLNLSDIAIVNIATQPVDIKTIKEHLKPNYLLLFDVESLSIKLPFIIPAFQVQSYDDCKIMGSPALSVMTQATTESTNLKRQLWTGLKKMFDIA